MGLGYFADTVIGGIEDAVASAHASAVDSVVRLGVTGLARGGKTVFITSLVANLMDRGRMPLLSAAAEGRILAAYLEPQPDDTVPRFDYEGNLAALTCATPHWPDSTRAVSQLRLSLKLAPGGWFAAVRGPRRVHVDIVDYPGEWLLDLALIDKSYAEWAQSALALALAARGERNALAAEWLQLVAGTDPAGPFDEATAQHLTAAYTAYLRAARDAGYSALTPGRFLLPGELAGSPALTFAPLETGGGRFRRGTLGHELARRYDAYVAGVAKPFFRDHFARLDRQVVLVDMLGALGRGPAAVADLGVALGEVMTAFRPGNSGWLARLIGRRRIDRVLFAASKADHLHHGDHAALARILQALLRTARDRSAYAGADTRAMAIAALRATVEESRVHEGRPVDLVRGAVAGGARDTAFHPGALPEDAAKVIAAAQAGAATWPFGEIASLAFDPAPCQLAPGEGPPHIRLDRAAEYLLGDKLS